MKQQGKLISSYRLTSYHKVCANKLYDNILPNFSLQYNLIIEE